MYLLGAVLIDINRTVMQRMFGLKTNHKESFTAQQLPGYTQALLV